jgi:two-component system sensor kinase FixL
MLARGKLLIGIVDISADKKAKTALENSEERYRGLFHFLPVAMLQLDRRELAKMFKKLHRQGVQDLQSYFREHPDFYGYAVNSIRVVEVNQRALELFRVSDANALIGPAARIWSEARETIQASMAARFSGAARFEAEIKIRAFDDQVRDALYVAHYPEAYEREALGLSCLLDISDRIEAQAKLTRMQAEFAHAARVSMLGELTASIAHEVNQPLGAILTSGETAMRWLDRSEPDLGELRGLAARTVSDAKRAGDIIRRIRTMASHGEPELLSLALNDVVEDVMVFLGPELRRQAVRATLDLSAGLPFVRGDRVQLQQVFANLAVNALQAGRSWRAPVDHSHRPDRAEDDLRGGGGHWSWHTRRSTPPPVSKLLHDQEGRHGHRPRHLPIDRRISRRSVGSDESARRARGALPFHAARIARAWVTNCFESGHTFRLGLRLTS